MIGDVKFHHPPPQFAQFLGFGAHYHSRCDGRGAGGGITGAPLNLYKTQTA